MVKIYKQPFAHGGDAIAIPSASQPDGKISSADGWTPDYQLPKTDPNYKPVGRQEMNGVFKEVTEALGEIQQFGFAKWQPITWPQGARVIENGVVYRALNQTSQQPPHADWIDDMDALILRLGTAATRDVVTSATDKAAGALVDTSWMGIAGVLPATLERLKDSRFSSSGGAIQNGLVGNFLSTHVSRNSNRSGLLLIGESDSAGRCYLATNFGTHISDINDIQFTELVSALNLMQSTGQSTDYPMTQKAVTDAINNSAIGVGQTWQDVTGSRVAGTTYTNTTGRPIAVSVYGSSPSSNVGTSLIVSGVYVSGQGTPPSQSSGVFAIVPPGATYSAILTNVSTFTWAELR